MGDKKESYKCSKYLSSSLCKLESEKIVANSPCRLEHCCYVLSCPKFKKLNRDLRVIENHSTSVLIIRIHSCILVNTHIFPGSTLKQILVLRILLRCHMELFTGNSLGHKSAECRMMKFCAGGSNEKTWQPSTTNDVMPDASFAVPSHVTPICICPLDL